MINAYVEITGLKKHLWKREFIEAVPVVEIVSAGEPTSGFVMMFVEIGGTTNTGAFPR